MTVWVCGEALIDLLPDGAVPGGGPANTAVALARLGIDVEFIGGISRDEYGALLRAHLMSEGVKMERMLESDLPTALAIASIDVDGVASYDFRLDQTATFTIDIDQLPPLHNPPLVLHIGSLATVVRPGAEKWLEWAEQAGRRTTVVLDPNIRPAVMSGAADYRTAIEGWLRVAHVIKASEDDLRFLYPDADPSQSARELLADHCTLVVVTRGSAGATAYTSAGEEVSRPGVDIDVVDTVGAGDTVGAVVVEALVSHSVEALHGERLARLLDRAVLASAITCTRSGANPPSLAELSG